uniref:Uncharacterized protein n=1 Tax=Arundo donax TaxID=35708 RepID=A0A0A8Y580_ARUDO
MLSLLLRDGFTLLWVQLSMAYLRYYCCQIIVWHENHISVTAGMHCTSFWMQCAVYLLLSQLGTLLVICYT